MADAYYLSGADVRYQKRVNRRVIGSRGTQRPPRKRRRHPVGGSGGSTLKWGLATSTITAATSLGSWGTGTVQPYDDAGDADGDPATIDNWFFTSFVDGAMIIYDSSVNRLVSGDCNEFP